MDYRVKELREKRGLSQATLSKLSGVSRPTISKLENSDEEVVINSKTLEKLAKALNVSIKTLFLPEKFNKEG